MLVSSPPMTNLSLETVSSSEASMSWVTGSSCPEIETMVLVVKELTGMLGSSMTVLALVCDGPLAALGPLNDESGAVGYAHDAGVEVIDRHVGIGGIQQLHVENGIDGAGHLAVCRLKRLGQVELHAEPDEIVGGKNEGSGEVHCHARLG